MSAAVDRVTRDQIVASGWQSGSTLENRAAHRLMRFHVLASDVVQQHRVGPYRIDFAWVAPKIALELDGWHHNRPETAAKDVDRDRFLRSQDWIVLRVHDTPDEMELHRQLARVVQIVNLLKGHDW